MMDSSICITKQIVGGPSAPKMTAVSQQPQEGYICLVHDASSHESILFFPIRQQLEKETS